MKIALIALVIVVVLTASLATAGHVYGWHSTPGIWLMVLNLPGAVVDLENDSMPYVRCAIVNWVFYFCLINVAVRLKRKFSN